MSTKTTNYGFTKPAKNDLISYGVFSNNWAAADTALHNLDEATVKLAGDTMTGPLILSGEPTDDNGAVNKKYVDDKIGEISDVLDTISGEVI
jgi:hypothetical protein